MDVPVACTSLHRLILRHHCLHRVPDQLIGGVNVVEVAVQGQQTSKSASQIVTKHFDYFFSGLKFARYAVEESKLFK